MPVEVLKMKLTLFARQRVSCTDARRPEKASFIGPTMAKPWTWTTALMMAREMLTAHSIPVRVASRSASSFEKPGVWR
ncbi:MAG: hypothetical protein DMF37_05815 [Verrucomicrobia bacterium]|nr:MAG: hypothetical protein DMF37_05815 [Verrucomicrobiota bacterium]